MQDFTLSFIEPHILKNCSISLCVAAIFILSPERRTKFPPGMYISESRCTAQIRNFILVRLYISKRLQSSMGELSGILYSTSSILPFSNTSTLAASGVISTRSISSAVMPSGFMAIDKPRSSLIKSICL